MQYIRFGSSGLMVSRLCWGAMNFYERVEESEAIRMVHEALEAGINFFDTADAYGMGRSEEMLGKALRDRRDHVVIATKLWVSMYKGDPNGRGCGRYHLTRAVEDSLRRLGTDHIDLYQLHHPDINAPVEETLATVDRLIQQGKIRFFGVCNHFAWQMAHMLGVAALRNFEPLISIQCHYNVFDRSLERDTAHFCRRFNIAAMTYGPLAGGILSGLVRRGQPLPEGSRAQKYGLGKVVKLPPGQTHDHMYEVIEAMVPMAAKYNLGLNQLAVKWVLSRDWITTPILGGSRAEHFACMYHLEDVEIDPADWEQLEEMTRPFLYVPFENQFVAQGAASQGNWW